MATVIKANKTFQQHSGDTLRTVAYSFEDMSGQADAYLLTVQDEAAKIIQEAHQQAERIRRDATEAGRQAAMDAASKVLDDKVAKHMETVMPAMRKAVADIEDAKNEWLSHWETSALSFSAAIAKRIVRREVAEHPEITVEQIRESLVLAAGAKDITLYLNADDHANLGDQIQTMTDSLSQLAPVEVIADKDYEPGDCRVVTEFGEIDHRLNSQIGRILEELTN